MIGDISKAMIANHKRTHNSDEACQSHVPLYGGLEPLERYLEIGICGFFQKRKERIVPARRQCDHIRFKSMTRPSEGTARTHTRCERARHVDTFGPTGTLSAEHGTLFEEGKNSTCASFEDLSIDDTLHPSLAHSTVFRFYPAPQSSCPFVHPSTSLPQSSSAKDILCSPLCAASASPTESPLTPLSSPCYATSAIPLIQPHPGGLFASSSDVSSDHHGHLGHCADQFQSHENTGICKHHQKCQSSLAKSPRRVFRQSSLSGGDSPFSCGRCHTSYEANGAKCGCDDLRQGRSQAQPVLSVVSHISHAADVTYPLGGKVTADRRCSENESRTRVSGGLTHSPTDLLHSGPSPNAVYTCLPLDYDSNSLAYSAALSDSSRASSFPPPPFRLPTQSTIPPVRGFLASLFSSASSPAPPSTPTSTSRRGGRASGWVRLDMWVQQRQTAPDAVLYAQVTESALLVLSPAAALRAAHLVLGTLQPIERAYLLSKMEARAAEAVLRQEHYLADLMVGNVSHACADICVAVKAPCRVLLPFQETVPESAGLIFSCGRFYMDTQLQLPRILDMREQPPERRDRDVKLSVLETSKRGGTPVSSLRIWGSQAWGEETIRQKEEDGNCKGVPCWRKCPERIYDRYGFACSDCAIMRVGDTAAFLKLMPFACSCSPCGELLAAISGSRLHVDTAIQVLRGGTAHGGESERAHALYSHDHIKRTNESGNLSNGTSRRSSTGPRSALITTLDRRASQKSPKITHEINDLSMASDEADFKCSPRIRSSVRTVGDGCCRAEEESDKRTAGRIQSARETFQENQSSSFAGTNVTDLASSPSRRSRPVTFYVDGTYRPSVEETPADSERKTVPMDHGAQGSSEERGGALPNSSSRQQASLTRDLGDDELGPPSPGRQPPPVYLLYPTAFRLFADICHLTRAEGCPALRLLFRDDSLIGGIFVDLSDEDLRNLIYPARSFLQALAALPPLPLPSAPPNSEPCPPATTPNSVFPASSPPLTGASEECSRRLNSGAAGQSAPFSRKHQEKQGFRRDTKNAPTSLPSSGLFGEKKRKTSPLLLRVGSRVAGLTEEREEATRGVANRCEEHASAMGSFQDGQEFSACHATQSSVPVTHRDIRGEMEGRTENRGGERKGNNKAPLQPIVLFTNSSLTAPSMLEDDGEKTGEQVQVAFEQEEENKVPLRQMQSLSSVKKEDGGTEGPEGHDDSNMKTDNEEEEGAWNSRLRDSDLLSSYFPGLPQVLASPIAPPVSHSSQSSRSSHLFLRASRLAGLRPAGSHGRRTPARDTWGLRPFLQRTSVHLHNAIASSGPDPLRDNTSATGQNGTQRPEINEKKAETKERKKRKKRVGRKKLARRRRMTVRGWGFHRHREPSGDPFAILAETKVGSRGARKGKTKTEENSLRLITPKVRMGEAEQTERKERTERRKNLKWTATTTAARTSGSFPEERHQVAVTAHHNSIRHQFTSGESRLRTGPARKRRTLNFGANQKSDKEVEREEVKKIPDALGGLSKGGISTSCGQKNSRTLKDPLSIIQPNRLSGLHWKRSRKSQCETEESELTASHLRRGQKNKIVQQQGRRGDGSRTKLRTSSAYSMKRRFSVDDKALGMALPRVELSEDEDTRMLGEGERTCQGGGRGLIDVQLRFEISCMTLRLWTATPARLSLSSSTASPFACTSTLAKAGIEQDEGRDLPGRRTTLPRGEPSSVEGDVTASSAIDAHRSLPYPTLRDGEEKGVAVESQEVQLLTRARERSLPLSYCNTISKRRYPGNKMTKDEEDEKEKDEETKRESERKSDEEMVDGTRRETERDRDKDTPCLSCSSPLPLSGRSSLLARPTTAPSYTTKSAGGRSSSLSTWRNRSPHGLENAIAKESRYTEEGFLVDKDPRKRALSLQKRGSAYHSLSAKTKFVCFSPPVSESIDPFFIDSSQYRSSRTAAGTKEKLPLSSVYSLPIAPFSSSSANPGEQSGSFDAAFQSSPSSSFTSVVCNWFDCVRLPGELPWEGECVDWSFRACVVIEESNGEVKTLESTSRCFLSSTATNFSVLFPRASSKPKLSSPRFLHEMRNEETSPPEMPSLSMSHRARRKSSGKHRNEHGEVLSLPRSRRSRRGSRDSDNAEERCKAAPVAITNIRTDSHRMSTGSACDLEMGTTESYRRTAVGRDEGKSEMVERSQDCDVPCYDHYSSTSHRSRRKRTSTTTGSTTSSSGSAVGGRKQRTTAAYPGGDHHHLGSSNRHAIMSSGRSRKSLSASSERGRRRRKEGSFTSLSPCRGDTPTSGTSYRHGFPSKTSGSEERHSRTSFPFQLESVYFIHPLDQQSFSPDPSKFLIPPSTRLLSFISRNRFLHLTGGEEYEDTSPRHRLHEIGESHRKRSDRGKRFLLSAPQDEEERRKNLASFRSLSSPTNLWRGGGGGPNTRSERDIIAFFLHQSPYIEVRKRSRIPPPLPGKILSLSCCTTTQTEVSNEKPLEEKPGEGVEQNQREKNPTRFLEGIQQLEGGTRSRQSTVRISERRTEIVVTDRALGLAGIFLSLKDDNNDGNTQLVREKISPTKGERGEDEDELTGSPRSKGENNRQIEDEMRGKIDCAARRSKPWETETAVRQEPQHEHVKDTLSNPDDITRNAIATYEEMIEARGRDPAWKISGEVCFLEFTQKVNLELGRYRIAVDWEAAAGLLEWALTVLAPLSSLAEALSPPQSGQDTSAPAVRSLPSNEKPASTTLCPSLPQPGFPTPYERGTSQRSSLSSASSLPVAVPAYSNHRHTSTSSPTSTTRPTCGRESSVALPDVRRSSSTVRTISGIVPFAQTAVTGYNSDAGEPAVNTSPGVPPPPSWSIKCEVLFPHLECLLPCVSSSPYATRFLTVLTPLTVSTGPGSNVGVMSPRHVMPLHESTNAHGRCSSYFSKQSTTATAAEGGGCGSPRKSKLQQSILPARQHNCDEALKEEAGDTEDADHMYSDLSSDRRLTRRSVRGYYPSRPRNSFLCDGPPLTFSSSPFHSLAPFSFCFDHPKTSSSSLASPPHVLLIECRFGASLYRAVHKPPQPPPPQLLCAASSSYIRSFSSSHYSSSCSISASSSSSGSGEQDEGGQRSLGYGSLSSSVLPSSSSSLLSTSLPSSPSYPTGYGSVLRPRKKKQDVSSLTELPSFEPRVSGEDGCSGASGLFHRPGGSSASTPNNTNRGSSHDEEGSSKQHERIERDDGFVVTPSLSASPQTPTSPLLVHDNGGNGPFPFLRRSHEKKATFSERQFAGQKRRTKASDEPIGEAAQNFEGNRELPLNRRQEEEIESPLHLLPGEYNSPWGSGSCNKDTQYSSLSFRFSFQQVGISLLVLPESMEEGKTGGGGRGERRQSGAANDNRSGSGNSQSKDGSSRVSRYSHGRGLSVASSSGKHDSLSQDKERSLLGQVVETTLSPRSSQFTPHAPSGLSSSQAPLRRSEEKDFQHDRTLHGSDPRGQSAVARCRDHSPVAGFSPDKGEVTFSSNSKTLNNHTNDKAAVKTDARQSGSRQQFLQQYAQLVNKNRESLDSLSSSSPLLDRRQWGLLIDRCRYILWHRKIPVSVSLLDFLRSPQREKWSSSPTSLRPHLFFLNDSVMRRRSKGSSTLGGDGGWTPWWRSHQSNSFWGRKEGTTTQLKVMENFSLAGRLQLKQSSRKDTQALQTEKEVETVTGQEGKEHAKKKASRRCSSSLVSEKKTYHSHSDGADWENIDVTILQPYYLTEKGGSAHPVAYLSADSCGSSLRRTSEDRNKQKDEDEKKQTGQNSTPPSENTKTAVLARVNVNPILIHLSSECVGYLGTVSYLASDLLTHISNFKPPPFQVDQSHPGLLSSPPEDLFSLPLLSEPGNKEAGGTEDEEVARCGVLGPSFTATTRRHQQKGVPSPGPPDERENLDTAKAGQRLGLEVCDGEEKRKASTNGQVGVRKTDSVKTTGEEGPYRFVGSFLDGQSSPPSSPLRATLGGSAGGTIDGEDGASLQFTSLEGLNSDQNKGSRNRRLFSPFHLAFPEALETIEERGLMPFEGRSEATTFVSCAAGTSSFLSIPEDFLDVARHNRDRKLLDSRNSKSIAAPSTQKWNQCYYSRYINNDESQPCRALAQSHPELIQSSSASPCEEALWYNSCSSPETYIQSYLNQASDDSQSVATRSWNQRKKTIGWNTGLDETTQTTALRNSVVGVQDNNLVDNEEEISSRKPTIGAGQWEGGYGRTGAGEGDSSRVSWSLLQPTYYGHSAAGMNRTSDRRVYGLLAEAEGRDLLKENEDENGEEKGAPSQLAPPPSEDAMETVWKSLAGLKANVDVLLTVESVKVKCVSIYFTFEEIHLGFNRTCFYKDSFLVTYPAKAPCNLLRLCSPTHDRHHRIRDENESPQGSPHHSSLFIPGHFSFEKGGSYHTIQSTHRHGQRCRHHQHHQRLHSPPPPRFLVNRLKARATAIHRPHRPTSAPFLTTSRASVVPADCSIDSDQRGVSTVMLGAKEGVRYTSLKSGGEEKGRLVAAENEKRFRQSVFSDGRRDIKKEWERQRQEKDGDDGEEGGHEEMQGFFKMTLMMEVLNRSMMAVESVIEPWNWTVYLQQVRSGKEESSQRGGISSMAKNCTRGQQGARRLAPPPYRNRSSSLFRYNQQVSRVDGDHSFAIRKSIAKLSFSPGGSETPAASAAATTMTISAPGTANDTSRTSDVKSHSVSPSHRLTPPPLLSKIYDDTTHTATDTVLLTPSPLHSESNNLFSSVVTAGPTGCPAGETLKLQTSGRPRLVRLPKVASTNKQRSSRRTRQLQSRNGVDLLRKQNEGGPRYLPGDQEIRRGEQGYGSLPTAPMIRSFEGQFRLQQRFLTEEERNAAFLWHFGPAAADLRIGIHLTWFNLTIAPLLMDAVMETTDSIEEQVKQLKDSLLSRTHFVSPLPAMVSDAVTGEHPSTSEPLSHTGTPVPPVRVPFQVGSSLSAFCMAVTAALGGGASSDDAANPETAEVSASDDVGPTNLNDDAEDAMDRRSSMANTRGEELLPGEERRPDEEKDNFDKQKEREEAENRADDTRRDSLQRGERERSAGSHLGRDDVDTVAEQASPRPRDDEEDEQSRNGEFRPLLWNLTGQPLAVRLATRRISNAPLLEFGRKPSSALERPSRNANKDREENSLSRSASSSATDDDLSVPPAETEVEDEDDAESVRSKSSFSLDDVNAGTSSSSASSETVENGTQADLRECSGSSFSSSAASSFSASSSCLTNTLAPRERNFNWSKLTKRRTRGPPVRRTSREGRGGSRDGEDGFPQEEGESLKEIEVTQTRKRALLRSDVFTEVTGMEGQLEDEYEYEWRTLPPEESLPLPQDEEVSNCTSPLFKI
ncbi:amine-terminal region of a tm vesicle-mediated sorter [Cystoisospora suis]|uniref:Amine-terminal region of a tm vesicle-mediated sorter n=1 Tax=Cystoisospora suis TaxID=483139 RepID=A0A2C6L1J1_9APIC|nr:amine-terminal region of a tm vesicle-mediated sorter [Cystoisospora suis]